MCVVFIENEAVSQQNFIDVVYLKNGSVIKGIIIEQIPNVTVKIKTLDGSSEIVCKMDDIEKIAKEETKRITNNELNNHENEENTFISKKNPFKKNNKYEKSKFDGFFSADLNYRFGGEKIDGHIAYGGSIDAGYRLNKLITIGGIISLNTGSLPESYIKNISAFMYIIGGGVKYYFSNRNSISIYSGLSNYSINVKGSDGESAFALYSRANFGLSDNFGIAPFVNASFFEIETFFCTGISVGYRF
jgi:hypothetical protein